MPDIVLLIISVVITIIAIVVIVATLDKYCPPTNRLWLLSIPIAITLWLWFLMYRISEPVIESNKIYDVVTMKNVDVIVDNGAILNLNLHFSRKFDEGSKIRVIKYKKDYFTEFGIFCTDCRSSKIEVVDNE